MKLLYGNGKVLEARDVGPVLVRFLARVGGPPIKFNGYILCTNEEARDKLKDIIRTNLYDREEL